MKKTVLIYILILFVLLSGRKSNSVERQLKDFAAFSETILQKEGRLDLHVSTDTLTYYFQKLKNELDEELSLIDQFKLYSSTLAKIQCGHTQIYPNKEVLREWLGERNSLPLDYFLHGKKLIVNKIETSDYKSIYEGKDINERTKRITSGSEILRIDRYSVPEMMTKIGQYISSDEDQIDFKYYQASHIFEFYRNLALPFKSDSVLVNYVTDGDTNEVYFQTGAAPVNTMNLRIMEHVKRYNGNEAEIGKFKIIKNKYGYFRFKSFRSGYGLNYNEFIRASFKKLNDRKIKYLVIDLRGNTGGVMQYEIMKYFVGSNVEIGKYVVEKPKSIHDSKFIRKFRSDYRKHKRLSIKQNHLIRNGKFNQGIVYTDSIENKHIFKGEIVVITDEGTFSSASIFASNLKTLANAKIVGSSAGGSFYSGNAGTLEIKLPHTGFTFSVNPNSFYTQLKPTNDPFEIKIPDLIVATPYLPEHKLDAFFFKEAVSVFE